MRYPLVGEMMESFFHKSTGPLSDCDPVFVLYKHNLEHPVEFDGFKTPCLNLIYYYQLVHSRG